VKFNVVLVLWGLLIGYVAFHDGSLDKLVRYVNPQAEPAKTNLTRSDTRLHSVKQTERKPTHTRAASR
jgi:hypothetical protein